MRSHLYTYRVPQRMTNYRVTHAADGYRVEIIQGNITNAYTFKTLAGANVFIKMHNLHS